MFKLLGETDFKTNTWAGGITRQLAIAPADALYEKRDFLWRVSSASVSLPESDFTALPDYERYISVTNGTMTLSHDGGQTSRTLSPGDIYQFDGGSPTHSTGVCTDFNLMIRKNSPCSGSMHFSTAPARKKLPLYMEETPPTFHSGFQHFSVVGVLLSGSASFQNDVIPAGQFFVFHSDIETLSQKTDFLSAKESCSLLTAEILY